MTIEFLLDTWKFFKNHFLTFALIIFPVTIPLEIVSFVYYQSVDVEGSFVRVILPEVVRVLFYPVYGAAVVFYMVSVIKGQALSVGQAWQLGLKYYGPYLLLGVILIVSLSFGFALFVLPGLFLAAKLAFSEFELLLGNRSPLDSLSSSWQMTMVPFWTLLQGGLLITGAIYLPYLFINYLLDGQGGDIANALARIVESLLVVLYTIFAYRVYDHETRGDQPTQ